jgi:hypothetical protein
MLRTAFFLAASTRCQTLGLSTHLPLFGLDEAAINIYLPSVSITIFNIRQTVSLTHNNLLL